MPSGPQPIVLSNARHPLGQATAQASSFLQNRDGCILPTTGSHTGAPWGGALTALRPGWDAEHRLKAPGPRVLLSRWGRRSEARPIGSLKGHQRERDCKRHLLVGGWRDGEGAVLNPTPSVLSIYLEELERGLSCTDSWTAFPRKDKRSRIHNWVPTVCQFWCWTLLAWCCLPLLSHFSRVRPVRPHPWDSPGKNAGVGCHFLLQWCCLWDCKESDSTKQLTHTHTHTHIDSSQLFIWQLKTWILRGCPAQGAKTTTEPRSEFEPSHSSTLPTWS